MYKHIKHKTEEQKRRSLTAHKYQEKLRREVLEHYSGSPPKCQCCGETIYEFLEIDHIKGGGKELRRTTGQNHPASWLRKHKYPKGFQILCSNCNHAKGIYGYCPHKILKLRVAV